MSAALISPDTSPPDSLTIDISANLLESFFEEKRLQRQRKARAATLNLLGIAASMLVSLGVFTVWLDANSDVEASREKLVKAEADLSAAGLGKQDEVAENVLKLPAQFAEKNRKLLYALGQTLAATGDSARLQTLSAGRDKNGNLKLVGQAETQDLSKVRGFLDRVQASTPGAQAMITTVSQAPGEGAANLLVSFEIVEGGKSRAAVTGGQP